MQKRLTFTDDTGGRDLFATLWDGIVLGASDNQPKNRDRRKNIAEIQRALIRISVPSAPDPMRTIKARSLIEGSGSQACDLEGTQLTLIGELLDKVPWGGVQLVAASDLDNFLGKLPDVTE